MDRGTTRATLGPRCFARPGLAAAFKFAGARRCNDPWPAVIGRESLLRIGAGRFDVRGLCGYRADVPIASGGFFFTRCARVDSAVAVVADVGIISYDDSGVIDIVDHVHVDVIDGGVVEEMAAIPASTFVAVAEVAEAIINSAVEAYGWTPEASGECEAAPVPAPPG